MCVKGASAGNAIFKILYLLCSLFIQAKACQSWVCIFNAVDAFDQHPYHVWFKIITYSEVHLMTEKQSLLACCSRRRGNSQLSREIGCSYFPSRKTGNYR